MKKIILTILFLGLSNYCFADITSNLVTHWKLNENAPNTSIFDYGGNNYTATSSSNTNTMHVSGIVNGGALSFNGTSQYASIPMASYNNLASGTISMWVYLNSNTSAYLIDKQYFGNGTYGLFSVGYYSGSTGQNTAGTAGSLYFHNANSNSSGYPGSTGTVGTGAWHLVSVTFSSTALNYYIDGSPDSGNPHSGNYSVANQLSATNASFGAWLTNGTTYYTNGSIDDIRIYSRVLSSSDESQLYATTSPGDYADMDYGLIGWWKLNDGAGSSALDSSGQVMTGNLNNSPSWVTGKIGTYALSFNGSNQNVNISDGSTYAFPNTTFTTSFWLNTLTTSASAFFAKDGASAGVGWLVRMNSSCTTGQMEVDLKGSGGVIALELCSSSTINDGNWHMVTFVITTSTSSILANTAIIYIDGVNKTGTSPSAGTTTYVAPTLSTQIASRQNTNYAQAEIDDVRIYNRALSATDVENLYNYTGKKGGYIFLSK